MSLFHTLRTRSEKGFRSSTHWLGRIVLSEEFWDLPDPFWVRAEVTGDDLDRLGHVNNAVYLAWCEQVAWDHAEAVGAGWDVWKQLDRGMAVQSVRLDYEAAAYQNDELLLGNWIAKNDRRLRATRRFQIVRSSDQQTLLRGEVDYVCIELSTGRPRRFPQAFKEAYSVLPQVQAELDKRATGSGA